MPSLNDIPDHFLDPPDPNAFLVWLRQDHIDRQSAASFLRIFTGKTLFRFTFDDRLDLFTFIDQRDARQEQTVPPPATG